MVLMRDNCERNLMIEKNMGLVGKVIKDNVHGIHNIGLFTYDDLFQIGCIGLCNAVDSYSADSGRCFSTYAYILIRNEIYGALKHATLRHKHETLIDIGEFIPDAMAEPVNILAGTVIHTLEAAKLKSNGVTAKGIDAIHLLAQGYTHREIGERMGGVSANNVSAWVAKARKYLRSEESVMALRDAV